MAPPTQSSAVAEPASGEPTTSSAGLHETLRKLFMVRIQRLIYPVIRDMCNISKHGTTT